MQHLVGRTFGQKVFNVSFRERREAHFDAVVRKDFDFGTILCLADICLKTLVRFQGAHRVIFAVWDYNQNSRAIVRHHQFFDKHARRITFARASRSQDREMRRDDILDRQHDGNFICRASQKTADVRGA